MSVMTVNRNPASPWSGLLDELFRREPLFAAAGLFLLLLMVPTGLAWLLDERTFADINVWNKSLKFEASMVMYLVTLAWFAKWLPAGTRQKRWYRPYTVAVVAALFAEMIWIGLASSLGVASHFNHTNLAWRIAFPVMGLTAIVFTVASSVFGYQVLRNPGTGLSPAVKTAIVYGMILTGVMTLITAGYLPVNGSHFVGGNLSDAEGAAIFGWARDGGDLRVAHFFATHALQVIPAFGIVWARVAGNASVGPVRLFVFGYVGLTAFTFVQAMMGRPFLPGLL